MADGGAFKPALLVIDFQEDFCPPVRHSNTSLHQHHHPAAYLAKDYGINFYAARVDGELRIVSQYVTCDECSMSGRVNGRPCSECKGTGWRYMDGRRLETLGTLVQVAKLQPPSAPEHRKEYDAE